MTLLLVNCEKYDSMYDSQNGSQSNVYSTLKSYLIQQNLDLDDVLADCQIIANDLVTSFITEENYYIIDIRDYSDYAAGHIEGAVHSDFDEIISTASNSGERPIVVVGYTGQTAAYAMVALRLSGYTDAKILKFGMSSWHSSLDRWTTNVDNIAEGHSNWSISNIIPTNVTYSNPVITSSYTSGADILSERVAFALSLGAKSKLATTVLNSPGSYFINVYWEQSDIDKYGNIDGAHAIKNELTLESGGISYLDPDQDIVTYGYTGQTSAAITAYLTILGYDAYNLQYGVNGMIYDYLEDHRWTAPTQDFPLVTDL